MTVKYKRSVNLNQASKFRHNKLYSIVLICCQYLGLYILQTEAGWEEYYDYIFPDDEGAKPNLKLLSMAKKWKEATSSDSDESDDDEDAESADEDKDNDTEKDKKDNATTEKLDHPKQQKRQTQTVICQTVQVVKSRMMMTTNPV